MLIRIPSKGKLPILADLVPMGGDNYKLVPRSCASEIDPATAARYLGISRPALYRLIESGHLQPRRPSKGKLLIPMEALTRFFEQSRDPEYWERQRGADPPRKVREPGAKPAR